MHMLGLTGIFWHGISLNKSGFYRRTFLNIIEKENRSQNYVPKVRTIFFLIQYCVALEIPLNLKTSLQIKPNIFFSPCKK